jgi:hypothetical protein
MTRTLERLRKRVRSGVRRWKYVHNNSWPDCGPCGAIAQAQIELGYGDTLVWCMTKEAYSYSEWDSHWTVTRDGIMHDLSGCYLDNPKSQPEYLSIRAHNWPACYTREEVDYWKRILRGEL